ncbi:MAG: PEP-CTERM sorting domain-containing protein, partial [Planctomycetia bacterium]|nr:PEP-CTERM sorting domain-containing protein [Planctomycetia bacterium]
GKMEVPVEQPLFPAERLILVLCRSETIKGLPDFPVSEGVIDLVETFDMNGRPVHISHSPIMQVPELATWGMFLIGLAGIYFLRKRRLRKNA